MIIDIHAHLWANSHETDKKTVLRACELYDISKVYISTLQSHYPSVDEVTLCNELTFDFMKEHPDVIGGFVHVDPTHSNCIDVLKLGVDRGMAGVKLWVAAKCDDYRVDAIAEECIRLDIPVLVHAFYKATGQLEEESTAVNVRCLALRYPKLKILMAHLGGNLYHGLRCIADLPNVVADFSGTMIGTGDIGYALEIVGEDRLLFGTDLPGGGRQCIAQVEEADLSKRQKEKIYRENAIRLLGGRS